MICADDRYNKAHKTCFGENAVDKRLKVLIEESKYCYKITKITFNKLLIIIKGNQEDIESFNKCWIFKKMIWKRWSESKRSGSYHRKIPGSTH